MKGTSGNRIIFLVTRIPLSLCGTLERFYLAYTCIFHRTMYFSSLYNRAHNEKH